MTDKQFMVQCIQVLKEYFGVAKNFPSDISKILMLADPGTAKWENTY